MVVKLTMGTDGALALQNSIQSELVTRGFSTESDPVMAEYITIMVINDKTSEQINAELVDLIGADYDSSFTDWLFSEALKAVQGGELSSPLPSAQQSSSQAVASPSEPTTQHGGRRASGPGAGLLQQALADAHPQSSSLGTAQKRSASARSPSPSSSQPNKARRTDAPTGPRAMMDRGLQSGNAGPRSLADRLGPHGGRRGGPNNLSPHQVSNIQGRIDAITGIQGPGSRHNMNGRGGMPQNMGMMNPAMNMGVNPMAVQEMMAMQMNLMAQMAANMGMMNTPQQQQQQQQQRPQRQQPPHLEQHGQQPVLQQNAHMPERGSGDGDGQSNIPSNMPQQQPVAAPVASQPSNQEGLPQRPGTPTLCKFGAKCTNPLCKYSHPSPVATTESGIVLSSEFCPKGKDCKDVDCTMGHVSPSVNGAPDKPPAPAHHVQQAAFTPTPRCKFGMACTRPGCMFIHPPRFRTPYHQPKQSQASVPCRFGASCTRGDCPFQHPKGHVAANMFYRGLSKDSPLVEGYVSPHRSVRFDNGKPVGAKSNEPQDESAKPEGKEPVAAGSGTETVGVGA